MMTGLLISCVQVLRFTSQPTANMLLTGLQNRQFRPRLRPALSTYCPKAGAKRGSSRRFHLLRSTSRREIILVRLEMGNFIYFNMQTENY